MQVDTSGVDDFSPWDSAMAEVQAYYDSGGPGPDCDSIPFVEQEYSAEFSGRLLRSYGSGEAWGKGGNHYSRAAWYTDTSGNKFVDSSFDPDGVKTVGFTDRWGRFAEIISPHNGGSDVISSRVHFDVLGRSLDIYYQANGGDTISMRQNNYNDLGQSVSTWKVDYGTIKMIYDDVGNLRFMQNDLRFAETTFVYYKYDALNRKIEEGVFKYSDTACFDRDHANDPEFPREEDTFWWQRKYLWFYDHYADDTLELIAPGHLVRVENGAKDYYKNYYYFPEEKYNLTLVKLPTLPTLKAIRHHFNDDGSMQKLVVIPNYPDTSIFSPTKVFEYSYDIAGRLISIDQDQLLGAIDYTVGEFEYLADGSINLARYGIRPSGEPVQKLDYHYNSRGWLTGINNVDSVEASFWGGVDGSDDNDHFALRLEYYDSIAGYYNGRVYRSTSVNSASSDTVEHVYEYDFNELDWLSRAVHKGDTSASRVYKYNDLVSTCINNSHVISLVSELTEVSLVTIWRPRYGQSDCNRT